MRSVRPVPLSCARCNSRTLRQHCERTECRWSVCLECDSVSGVVSIWKMIGIVDHQGSPVRQDREFVRYDRNWFGGMYHAE